MRFIQPLCWNACLSAKNIKYTAFHDGVAALDTAIQLLPDLILLDVQMPGMNGFDVLRELRRNPATVSIPTIVVTAKAKQSSDVEQGLDLGADDYIYKPFDPRELLARAESKMKARRLEESLQRRTQELQALLRVGEELNHTLEVNELLELILYLTLDLLPGNLTAIFQFDDQEELIAHRFQTSRTSRNLSYNSDTVIERFLQSKQSTIWPGGTSLSDNFPSGMATVLMHGESLLGLLMMVSEERDVYDENHFRLFEGISRQAALALRNTELYAILAEHAEHLEDMVATRTADLQSAQQMLVRSEKLASIGHLAASIAHEINNPLQPIRIHLEHMAEDIQHGDPIDQIAVTSIQESIERITRIVSQLLDFAGKRSTSADAEFIDLQRTLNGVINLNRKLFEQSGIHLIADISPLPQFYGSKDQLEQVFMNLALNAQAATTRDGSLHIKASVVENDIIIQFTDTGTWCTPRSD